jgi:hypothetical protein
LKPFTTPYPEKALLYFYFPPAGRPYEDGGAPQGTFSTAPGNPGTFSVRIPYTHSARELYHSIFHVTGVSFPRL